MKKIIRIRVSDGVSERFHLQKGRGWKGEKILLNGLLECEGIDVEKVKSVPEKKPAEEKRKINFNAFPKYREAKRLKRLQEGA